MYGDMMLENVCVQEVFTKIMSSVKGDEGFEGGGVGLSRDILRCV